jgi:type 1 glutamine amidotransferase
MGTLALLLSLAPADLPRVLFLTHSADFKHTVVTRPADGSLSLAERQLAAAARGLFEVDATQDCAAITAANLAKYRAVVFYTTGELPIDEAGRAALLEYVKRGGGFAGIHAATDTFHKWPPFVEMIGGEFDQHPWVEKVRVRVEDRAHPATAHYGAAFDVDDEIYQFKNWDRSKLHVLLSLDPERVDLKKEHVKRTDRDFAVAWCKPYGQGRVFYTSLGHREAVWQDPMFLHHVVQGIAWAMGGGIDDDGFELLLGAPGWKQAGPGKFTLDAQGVATCHGGMGLWWLDRELGNYLLRVEFQQGRPEANSGLFIRFPDPGDDPWVAVRRGYEIQISDDKITKNGTGAIYDLQAPKAVPLKPAGEWNEYEIGCFGNRTYVTLNGRLVNEFAGDRGPRGRIGLQNHADRDVVRFRNLRVRELPDRTVDYHVLFDGTAPRAWKQAGPGSFLHEGDALVSEGGMGLFWHPRVLRDFILLLDFQVGRAEDNSGVFVRFPDPGDDPWVAVKQGYEIQLCDAAPAKHRTGSVYDFQDARAVPTKPPGEWNHLAIVCEGQRYVVKVNGMTVNEFTGDRGVEGRIGLQNHDAKSRVRFRNVRVIELK